MRRHRVSKRRDDEMVYWMSYSDMMAGLLLVFILIISFTMLHSKMSYDDRQAELSTKEEELAAKEDEIFHKQEIITEQEKQLQAQADAIEAQGFTIDEQDKLLSKFSDMLNSQQQAIDDIVGVRAALIKALSEAFSNSNLKVTVDDKTGAITFDSNILFDYDKSDLKPSGKEFLDSFIPKYMSIITDPKYKDNISEILIEGHTDTDGSYLYNLKLSQERALSVAEYCLDESTSTLTQEQRSELRKVISATGRSFSKPVYNEDGTVNMDASRRVEFTFRLKDEEMIREMLELLSAEDNGDN